MERALTIVGEAAKRMSEPFRAAHPEIAWPKVIGLRNVLMHQYDKIDNHRIFVIATELVPKLVEILNGLLASHTARPELQDEESLIPSPAASTPPPPRPCQTRGRTCHAFLRLRAAHEIELAAARLAGAWWGAVLG